MSVRITHIITGLNVGGAERVLLNLSSAWRNEGIESHVICLGPQGPVSERLEDQGATVEHVGLRSIWRFPLVLDDVASRLVLSRADVVQGWMYHGNLAAQLARRDSLRPVVWNIRQSLHKPQLFKATTRITIRANAWLSRRADSIIYNSCVARRQHEAIGFCADRGLYIANGVDLNRFAPDNVNRSAVRSDLGLAENDLVAIAVGRAHPIKGHAILMRAIREAARLLPDIKLIVVGRGTEWEHPPYSEFSNDALVRDHTILLGERSDVPKLLSAADVFVSSSETEGFPNAVAEAMAACLPCVVTDVGDSAFVVDDAGVIVAPGDASQLAGALQLMLETDAKSRAGIGARARARIEDNFSLPLIARQYADHYRQLVSRQNDRASH